MCIRDRFWSSSKNKEMLQLAAATSFIEKAKMTNFTTVTVSYTHLDVYKRQKYSQYSE